MVRRQSEVPVSVGNKALTTSDATVGNFTHTDIEKIHWWFAKKL